LTKDKQEHHQKKESRGGLKIKRERIPFSLFFLLFLLASQQLAAALFFFIYIYIFVASQVSRVGCRASSCAKGFRYGEEIGGEKERERERKRVSWRVLKEDDSNYSYRCCAGTGSMRNQEEQLAVSLSVGRMK